MAASLKRPNLWLYLQFPLLPLEALTRAEPDTDQTAAAPRAVITARGNPRRVLCCNLAAEQCGLEAEMVLPTALAICPELRTLPRQTDSEQALLQHLVLVAYRFSPEVIIDQAGGLWLELSGCEKLLGGFTPLLQALDQAINQPPLAIASGFGVSPEAARLLSRPGFQTRVPGPEILRRQLAAAPLAKLDTSVRKQADLAKLGFDTVGDLLALPNKVLGRRFGAAFLEQLARLTGRQPCRWPRFQPPSYFEDSLQHPDGIQNKEGLLFPMKALLQRFCHYLMARQCHCQAMQWGFEPLLGEPVTITVQLTSGQNRWSSLLAISRLQLERLALPGSIEMIRLTSRQLAPAPGDTPDLFSGADGQRNDSELLDTLRARLGVEALSQPVLHPEPLPEQAGPLEHCHTADTTVSTDAEVAQPLWLLPKPAPLQQRDGQPVWNGPMAILRGPQRLRGNWWQGEQQRDYYLASDCHGGRYWLFRDARTRRWFVQGIFA